LARSNPGEEFGVKRVVKLALVLLEEDHVGNLAPNRSTE
jgi:hypothetical protein